MSAKSILIIGDVKGYTGLISYALMKGYRILYTEDVNNGLSSIDQESVRLVIIGEIAVHVKPEKDPSLMKLIKLEIPIILTGRNVPGNAIEEALQDQRPMALPEAGSREDVNNAVECFFNGRQEEAMESNCLIVRQERNFTSLELNGDRNAQKVQGRIRRAIAFMEEHYDEDISLDQIAHAAYLNPYYFCRLFRKEVGTTCSKYLSILRIEKAKELLRERELSVTEICFEVGFNSLTHFERVFKGLEGRTPSEYRRLFE